MAKKMIKLNICILVGVALTFSLYFFLFSPVCTSKGCILGRKVGRHLVGAGESIAVSQPLADDRAITTNSALQNDFFGLPSFNSSFDTDKCRLALKVFELANGIKKLNCEIVFEVVKYCHRFNGLRPLPNFYLRRKQGFDDIKEEDYLRAHLAFIHVPKVGGTSVETFLKKYKTRPAVNASVSPFWLGHCGDFLRAVNRVKPTSTPVFFYSKRSFGIHYYLPTARTFMYVTWIREPVSRFMSTYHYLKRKRPSGQPRNRQYVFTSKNLTTFLESSHNVQLPDFDNFMVRLLQFGNFPEVDIHFEDCCGASSPDIIKVEEKHYLVAKKNLQLMAFIGCTEDFKVSQDMFMNILGKKPAEKEVHKNSNRHSTNITDWERSEIERRVYWDIKLYQDAKKIFEKQKKEYLHNRTF